MDRPRNLSREAHPRGGRQARGRGRRGDLLRKLALAALGILVVGGVAIAVILFTGGDVGTSEAPPPVAAAAPEPRPIPIGPLPGIGIDGKPLPPPPETPVEYDPEPPPPDPDSWEAVPAAARPSALGRIGPVLNAELANLQPTLAQCLDEETQARNGQFPVSRSLDGRTPEENERTVLVLQLELTPGQIRIVDAPVESQGRSSDGRVACAQRLLRGHVIRSPVVRSAGRARMVLPLSP